MKISLNEIKKYVKVPENITTKKLVELIGARLVEVEETEDWSEKYRNIYVVKVVECEKIEGTHLSLCKVDAGSVAKIVFPNNESNLVQVVCGAPNVHSGMFAVWIAPGAIVPSTFGGENFQISTRKLRGYESNGMLAAIDELALGTDHEGIAELDPKFCSPGDNFAEKFDLNDTILDIENKSLTHRPDCFGIIGFAREVAGILGISFKTPEFLLSENVFEKDFFEYDENNNLRSKNCNIEIEVKNNELCPRYTCAVINLKNATAANKYLTPMTVFLAKADMRSVSRIVDITNYLMLTTGQPLHAFDCDKFLAVGKTKTPKIVVRAAKNGEELKLLDGKTISCNENDILITSNNTPTALAGAMGGFDTEIDASTTSVLLESATFSLYHLRKTQMKHGLFSEAITRFTKGQPAGQTFNVLAEAIKLLGGSVISVKDHFPMIPLANVVKITTKEINSLLGTNYDTKLIVKTLTDVEFFVEQNGDALTVTAPFWRTDIHIKEDIIEEVGRLLGYDNIALDFPKRQFKGVGLNELWALKADLRSTLSNRLNANEVLTYSFVNKNLLEKVGQTPDDSYEIVNSISPDLQCFRQTLVPSLLSKVRENLKAGYSDFALYELNQITRKSLGSNSEKVPLMKNSLGLVLTGDYYKIKNFSELLWRNLNIVLKNEKFDDKTMPYFEPMRAISLYSNNEKIGAFGEIRASVLKKMKIDRPISALEIDIEKILTAKKRERKTFNLSKFPSVERDLTFKTSVSTNFGSVTDLIQGSLRAQDLLFTVSPISIYQANKNDQTKNLSFHLRFSSPEKTLSSDEISVIIEKVSKTVCETVDAELI